MAIKVYGFQKFNPNKFRYKRGNTEVILGPSQDTHFKIIFDGQCLQTLTRQRGIGQYSLRLIQAVCLDNPESNFGLLLNSISSPQDLLEAKKLISNLNCPNLHLIYFNPFESRKMMGLKDIQGELQIFLNQLNPEWLITLSNFEKTQSVIPIPSSANYRRASILYDLIPLQYSDQLLISNRQRTSYHLALQQMQEFDLLLSISKESKIAWQELVNSQSNIEVIYGGGSQGIAKAGKDLANRRGLLCVSAEMPHKNIKRLIEAYSLLPIQTQHDHPLIVVGIRSKGMRSFLEKHARKLSSNVFFPPYLIGAELEDLYSGSRLLVMPSLVEGLSLPILEAWSHGFVAIGSANTVAEELIQDKNCLFDPTNPESMSKTITLGLTDDSFWKTSLVAQQKRFIEFTWEATSSRLISAIKGGSRE